MKAKDFLESDFYKNAQDSVKSEEDVKNQEEMLKGRFEHVKDEVKKAGFLDKINNLFNYLIDPKANLMQKILVIAGIAYVITPIDFIPDFIPVVGWLDDIGVVTWILKSVSDAADNYAVEKNILDSNAIDEAGFEKIKKKCEKNIKDHKEFGFLFAVALGIACFTVGALFFFSTFWLVLIKWLVIFLVSSKILKILGIHEDFKEVIELAWESVKGAVGLAFKSIKWAFLSLKRFIFTAKETFEEKNGKFLTTTTTFISKDQENVSKVTNQKSIDWSEIPDEVRKSYIKEGKFKEIDAIKMREQELAMRELELEA